MAVRIAAMGGLVLIALLLKTIVAPTFAVAGYRPDLLVLVVVGISMLEGPDTGLRLGFFAGLAQDLVSGSDALVGLWALVIMGIGYASGLAKPYLAATAQAPSAILLGGVMAAMATLAYGVLGKTFAVVGATWGQVLAATLVVGVYSALLAPFVIRPTQAVMRQFPATPS